MTHNINIPRFVTCSQHEEDDDLGNIREYSWDKDNIFVAEHLHDDPLMLQNVFEGKIISPAIYPLVFDKKASYKEISVRSLEFYAEVDQHPEMYTSLSSEDKMFFHVGLRDLFVASCRQMLSENECELLRRMADLVNVNDDDKDIVVKTIQNLRVTPYPTYKNKIAKFVDATTEGILESELFIVNELNMILCFVDPQELSYHNFENIINLDSLFQKDSCEFVISNVCKYPDSDVYTFEMSDKTKILASLDKYGLYVPPLNKLSRGGQRFIFSSEKLCQALSDAFTGTQQLKDDDVINENFKFVNYVFRYNKFTPTDKKFATHMDTPYHDPTNKHYSRYTVIFYLTSGKADPVLSIDNSRINITEIDTKGEIKGVIFDQKYEHEGKSFMDGDKIFLRSELIFEYDDEDDGFSFDEAVSKKFNIACYMTKQSAFNPELEKYASDCFNQAAEARVKFSKDLLTENYLLYKRYLGTPFITNGYDYWFGKDDVSLKDAAVVAVMDYFNCKFESGESFNKLTYNEVLPLDVSSIKDIHKHMEQSGSGKSQESKSTENYEEEEKKSSDAIIDTNILIGFSEEWKKALEGREKCKNPNYCCVQWQCRMCPDREGEDHCCDQHARMRGKTFDPFKCTGVMNYLCRCYTEEKAQRKMLQDQYSVFIADEQVTIDKDKLVVEDNTIIFNNQIPLINFAACWQESAEPANYIAYVSRHVKAYGNIPPVLYETYEEGYHLKIELFNNRFVRRAKVETRQYGIEENPVRPEDCEYWWNYRPLDIYRKPEKKKKKKPVKPVKPVAPPVVVQQAVVNPPTQDYQDVDLEKGLFDDDDDW